MAEKDRLLQSGDGLEVLSLFAGIGGIDLGLERAGMTVVGQVEINPFCKRILEKHWPEVPRHDDVRTAVEWWGNRPAPSVVAGGFPCQDISDAHTNGTRAALDGPRSGLWSAYRTVVAELKPRWVIAENVAAWRRWVPGVRSDLHELGYASVPLCLSAGSFGAPHKRPRVVVVADSHRDGESLRAIHAEVARLRPVPRGGGDWRDSSPVDFRVADGLPGAMDRDHALGNSVVPAVAEFVGRAVMVA
jgi:DNA (cytosine-5)-methyltransferase 1